MIARTLFFLALFLGFSAPVPKDDDWELRKSEKGISVYTRNSASSSFKELKAVYKIKASLSSVITLLNDADSYPKWVFRCGNSRVLKKSSDQDLIRYQSVVAPWPVDNRDMIVEVHTRQDEKTGIVYQRVTGLPDYLKTVPGHVRIREFKALWTLIPQDDGMLEINYELQVNPGGAIPAWVVNMAVVDGPFETSVNMKEWLMKDEYKNAKLDFIREP